MGPKHQGSRSTRALDVRVLRFQNQPNTEEPAMLTRDLLIAGRMDDARAVFEAAIERDPGDADLLLTGGELFLERGDFVWAKRLLILAAKRSVDWASPWLALARVLLATRDFGRAEAVLDRCWELAPGAPETWALDERLSGESALERRMRAFLADPSRDDPAMLANALLAAEREEDAMSVLDCGLRSYPDDVDALFVRARLHELRGELERARADLSRATGSDGSWATAWEALEDVCRQSGDHAGARKAESSARHYRERDANLADLDRAFMIGAAEILTVDLATLAEPADAPSAEGFAPVPTVAREDERALPFEARVAQGVPVEEPDLFPTYSQVHETLPPPALAADTLSEAAPLHDAKASDGQPRPLPEGAFDIFIGDLTKPDTLVGHPAPSETRGLRGAESGRKPYVPPSPAQLRPSDAPPEDTTERVTVPIRKPGRSWAR
jgi:tetratricopeptide (TPR) repeat protein